MRQQTTQWISQLPTTLFSCTRTPADLVREAKPSHCSQNCNAQTSTTRFTKTRTMILVDYGVQTTTPVTSLQKSGQTCTMPSVNPIQVRKYGQVRLGYGVTARKFICCT